MKCFLILIFLFSFTNIFAQTTQETQTCLNKGKEFFEQKEYSYAQKTLEDCLKTNPNDVDILVSLGGVCMKQENFNQALIYFNNALKNMTKQSPYVSYVYTRMGDCYTHIKDFAKAAKYYDASLKYEPANINSLVGKGICEEQLGNIPQAAQYFKKALAVDFTNIVARRRLIALEPGVLSEEELVATMKERNILDPHAKTYQEQDLDLLKKMLKAERNKAVKYLNDKYEGKIPPGLVIEKYSGKIYARKILSYSGYHDLMFLLSQDAIDFFIKEGAYKSEILKLRDFDGNKIFNEKGFLTHEGLIAYNLSLNGQKSYLLPSEPLPSASKKAQMKVQELLKQGYMEITIEDYGYIMDKTRCNEKTLVNDLGIRIVQGTPGRNRFLVLDPIKLKNQQTCPFNLKACPYEITQERKKEKKNSTKTPVYTSTFGTGTKRTYLCKEDGTLETFGGQF